jgi:hypothetical protein
MGLVLSFPFFFISSILFISINQVQALFTHGSFAHGETQLILDASINIAPCNSTAQCHFRGDFVNDLGNLVKNLECTFDVSSD